MKKYIQKIIRIFIASKREEKITAEVHQWLLHPDHADEKDKALYSLWNTMKWNTTEDPVEAKTWDSLLGVYKKIGVNSTKTFVNKSFRTWRYAAVFFVLVISVSTTFFYTKKNYSDVAMIEKFTPYGHLDNIELPDGSIVQTNSGTVLFYPESFKGDTRTVYLVGEANFKVKKNSNQLFVVKSGAVSVTALGTEFNVLAYPKDNRIVATLISGKVRVDCEANKQTYTLTPGQQILYEKHIAKSHLIEANLSDVTAWQRGTFVFRGSTVDEMLTVLERRYNVSFQYDVNYSDSDKYNFEFPEKSTIQEIMSIIQVVVGNLDYEFRSGTCYIKAQKKK